MRKFLFLFIAVFTIFSCETDEIFDLNQEIKALTATVYEHESESLQRDADNFAALQAAINAQAEINAQLEAAIAAEEEARKSEDVRVATEALEARNEMYVELSNSIATVAADLVSTRNALEKAIDEEAAARLAGDLALAETIAEEVVKLEAADSILQKNIELNELRIQAANIRLTREINDRIAQDLAHTASITANFNAINDNAEDIAENVVAINANQAQIESNHETMIAITNTLSSSIVDLQDEVNDINEELAQYINIAGYTAKIGTEFKMEYFANSKTAFKLGVDNSIQNEGNGASNVNLADTVRPDDVNENYTYELRRGSKNYNFQTKVYVRNARYILSIPATYVKTELDGTNFWLDFENNAIDVLQFQITQNTNAIAALTTSVTTLITDLDAAEDAIEELGGDLDDAVADLEGLISDNAALISGNSDLIEGIQDDIVALEAFELSATQSITTLETELAALEAELDEVKSDVASNTDDIENLADNDAFTQLQNKVAELEAEIDAINVEVEEASETDLAALNAKINQLKDALADADVVFEVDLDFGDVADTDVDPISVASNATTVAVTIEVGGDYVLSGNSGTDIVSNIASITYSYSFTAGATEGIITFDFTDYTENSNIELSVDLVEQKMVMKKEVKLGLSLNSEFEAISDLTIPYNSSSTSVTVSLKDGYQFKDGNNSNTDSAFYNQNGININADFSDGGTTANLVITLSNQFDRINNSDVSFTINASSYIEGKTYTISDIRATNANGFGNHQNVSITFGTTKSLTFAKPVGLVYVGGTYSGTDEGLDWTVTVTDGQTTNYTVDFDIDPDTFNFSSPADVNIDLTSMFKVDPCTDWNAMVASDIIVDVPDVDNYDNKVIQVGTNAYTVDILVIDGSTMSTWVSSNTADMVDTITYEARYNTSYNFWYESFAPQTDKVNIYYADTDLDTVAGEAAVLAYVNSQRASDDQLTASDVFLRSLDGDGNFSSFEVRAKVDSDDCSETKAGESNNVLTASSGSKSGKVKVVITI